MLCHIPSQSGPKISGDLVYIIISLASRRPTTAPVASRVSGSASAATRGRGSSAAKRESKPSSSLLAKSPSSSTSSLNKPAQSGTKGTCIMIMVLLVRCSQPPLSFLFKKGGGGGLKCLASEVSCVS